VLIVVRLTVVVASLLDRPQIGADSGGVVARFEHEADAERVIFVWLDWHPALAARRTRHWRQRKGVLWNIHISLGLGVERLR